MREMRAALIILIFISSIITLFLTGCSPNQSQKFVCDEPYIEAWNGVETICCLDLNHDNVCDSLRGNVEAEGTKYYHGEKHDKAKILEELSREKQKEHELEDEYDVKKALWDREKEDQKKEKEDEELVEEFS